MRAKYGLIIFTIVFYFIGCVPATSIHNFYKSQSSTLENEKGNFIELKKGEIIFGKSVQEIFNKNLPLRESTIMLDGKKYSNRKIKAYQNDTSFFLKVDDIIFAERIIKGKLNVYRVLSKPLLVNIDNSGVNRKAHYLTFFQKGNDSKLYLFSETRIKKLINDNPNALNEFNKYKKLKEKEKITNGDIFLNNMVDIYNRE